MLKKHSGNENINKYNDFDLFNQGNLFNKYYFKANKQGFSVLKKINLILAKTINILQKTEFCYKQKELTKMIENNYNKDYMIKKIKNNLDINDEHIDLIFPSKEPEKHNSIIQSLNEEALNKAKLRKIEEELILSFYLVHTSKKISKKKKKEHIDILKKRSKDFFKSKHLRANNNLQKILKNENKTNSFLKKIELAIPHIIDKKNKTINRIPESTYFEKELIFIINEKIEEKTSNSDIKYFLREKVFSNADIKKYSIKNEGVNIGAFYNGSSKTTLIERKKRKLTNK